MSCHRFLIGFTLAFFFPRHSFVVFGSGTLFCWSIDSIFTLNAFVYLTGTLQEANITVFVHRNGVLGCIWLASNIMLWL